MKMKTSKNLMSCVYETKLWGACRIISITWHETLLARTLILNVADSNSQLGFLNCQIDIRPWFSWNKQGRKTIKAKSGDELQLFWNLNDAKFGCGAEPLENFFVSLVSGGETILLLGDLQAEAYKTTRAEPLFLEPVMVSSRAHILGKKYYTTIAQIGDKRHEIEIKCHIGGSKEPKLYLSVDKKVVLKVKHLAWKFRGNRTVLIDGDGVEFFWDVHNWLFDSIDGHAVFMFQICPLCSEEKQRSHGHCHHHEHGLVNCYPWNVEGEKKQKRRSCRSLSVMQWASNGSLDETESRENPGGFSLMLYAWKNN